MKMKNYLFIMFVAVTMCICVGVNAYSQHNTIIESDSIKLFEGFSRSFLSPAKPEQLPAAAKQQAAQAQQPGSEQLPVAAPQPAQAQQPVQSQQVQQGEVVFRVVKITNIQGNNPLNPAQPVYNFGGVTVSNTDDLIDCVRGGTCVSSSTGGGGTLVCSPNSGFSDVASLIESVGCYVKGNGTICRVERLPSFADLSYELFFVMYDTISASVVAATASVSDYKMTKPPSNNTVISPGGDTFYKINAGTYTTEVQHKSTGARYRINFTVTNLGGNNFRLTVNSLTKI